MPDEPSKGKTGAKRRAKVVDDEFVVVEVDGYALMTPEQRTWPVYRPTLSRPEPNPTGPAEGASDADRTGG